jgi:hypothetical protein
MMEIRDAPCISINAGVLTQYVLPPDTPASVHHLCNAVVYGTQWTITVHVSRILYSQLLLVKCASLRRCLLAVMTVPTVWFHSYNSYTTEMSNTILPSALMMLCLGDDMCVVTCP